MARSKDSGLVTVSGVAGAALAARSFPLWATHMAVGEGAAVQNHTLTISPMLAAESTDK